WQAHQFGTSASDPVRQAGERHLGNVELAPQNSHEQLVRHVSALPVEHDALWPDGAVDQRPSAVVVATAEGEPNICHMPSGPGLNSAVCGILIAGQPPKEAPDGLRHLPGLSGTPGAYARGHLPRELRAGSAR